MISSTLVAACALAYLLTLFAVAYWADARARAGRSVIGSAWIYALSMAVYCTAWTYFGSIGRAAVAGLWFLPIYLGPMLTMLLAWPVLRKMLRIAKTYRITSIADFIASRYGKSRALAVLVSLITVIGIVPYIALQLKAISGGYQILTAQAGHSTAHASQWWQDSALYIALLLAGFTVIFGTRRLDTTERHEGLVAAIAFESLVKLLAFWSVGIFVCYGLFNGLGDVFERAMTLPDIAERLQISSNRDYGYTQWFVMTLLSALAVVFLPRQFQVMIVENVDERHLRRASWVFPLYLLLINVFVLPIALAGLLLFAPGTQQPDHFLLTLPLLQGHPLLALLAYIGGLSAATGMVIVEAVAVSTMVCNDLVMPALLRRGAAIAARADLTGLLLTIRRLTIFVILLLGYAYYRLAGDAYALVGIGLISFAAVAQFAPAMLGGMYWKGATRLGAIAGLLAGFTLWVYTLLLPSLAKSGWIDDAFLRVGPAGLGWLKPEALFGLVGFDSVTHSLIWSMLVNIGIYVGVSLWRRPEAAEASQSVLFVDVFNSSREQRPVFWQGTAHLDDLRKLAERFLGTARTRQLFDDYAQGKTIEADANFVHFVESQIAGAIGSASARLVVAQTVQEENLDLDDVLRILDEASQLRQYSRQLEEKSHSLELASNALRQANEQLKSLDKMKDDFMSSVTHELRTPLTTIRAMTEMMVDDAEMPTEQRQQFLGIVVAETERLSRLVNQVLDMAKIESGNGQWLSVPLDFAQLVRQVAATTTELFNSHGARLEIDCPDTLPTIEGDADRLTQVLMNLLGNAVKFLPAENGLVRISVTQDDERITVCVHDNGSGVAPEQAATIFEKFRQGGDGGYRPQGTGLGLPICKQIIEHHGGRIWVDTSVTQGACFCFTLPMRAATVAPTD